MKSWIAALTLLAELLVWSGCATTHETAGKGQRALVCPRCKMVAMIIHPSYYGNASRRPYGGTQTVYKDTCPGCQGEIETFLKEGKWKHRCSVCETSPFTCPGLSSHGIVILSIRKYPPALYPKLIKETVLWTGVHC